MTSTRQRLPGARRIDRTVSDTDTKGPFMATPRTTPTVPSRTDTRQVAGGTLRLFFYDDLPDRRR